MKLLYDANTGIPIQAVQEAYTKQVNLQGDADFQSIEIDESLNPELCRTLETVVSPMRVNAAGEQEYYIKDGELYQRDGWTLAEESAWLK